ncbi:MAG: hypothetical protein RL748_1556, partial [Pseudomonadota bacterium]
MNSTNQAIPAPKSWEQFEELCLALFRAVWQDAAAKKNGGQGQQQHGVDIVGVNHAQDGGTWGVQCVFIPDGQSVSIAKITQDLAKADQFRPKLAGLIVATSSLADGRVLQHCKISSNERAVQGLFPVQILDWAQIQTLLRANPQVAKSFYPDLFPAPVRWPAVPLVEEFFDPLNSFALLQRQLKAENSVVVQGVGGVGKTQLALKYCHKNQKRYAGVWWFQAETASTLEQDCILFCHLQGVPVRNGEAAAQAMQAWLTEQVRRQARWLLVYDNAQDLKVVRNFLPQHGQHHVIITSRISNWPGIGNVALNGWPVKAAISFFGEIAHNYFEAKDKPVAGVRIWSAVVAVKKSPEEDASAKLAEQVKVNAKAKVQAKTLGDFPLPLTMRLAISYILSKKVREFDDYVRKLANYAASFSSGEDLPLHTCRAIATFALTHAALSTPAQALLGLCAWFSSAPVPEYLFSEKNDYLPAILQPIAANPSAWRKTVAELEGYALCSTQQILLTDHRGNNGQQAPCLIFHDLTREAARATALGSQFSVAALLLVQAAFPFDVTAPQNGPRCRALLPHAEAIRDFYQAAWNQPACFGRMLIQMAIYLKTGQGLYHRALALEQQAYDVLQEALGDDDTATLIAMNNLADTQHELGDLAAAKVLQEKALATGRHKWGEDDPNTLISLSNFASTLLAMNDLPGALKLDEQVLATRIRDLGDEHPQTLLSMNSVAMTRWQMGDLPGARALQEKLLAISQRVLGPEHLQTVGAMNNLANTVMQLGELPRARDLHEKALAISSRVQGTEHPNTLRTMSNLAETLAQVGDLRAARTLAENALTISQRVLGQAHPLVFQIKENLAQYLEQDGSLAAAQALRNEVLAVRRAQNGASQNQATNTPSRFVLVHPEELQGNVDPAQYRTWHRTWLQTLTLTEFRCFEQLEITLSEQLTVFIAPNGAGKTTVLDAIALAMGQFVQCFQNGIALPLRKSDARLCPTNLALDLGTMEPRYPVAVAAQGEVDGKPFNWQYSQPSVNAKPVAEGKSPVAELGNAMQQALGQDQPVVLPLLAYYGTQRLQKKEDLAAGASIAQFESGFFSRTAGYKDCLDSAADYKEFEQWFAYAASVNEGLADRKQVPPARGGADAAPKAEVGFAPLIQSVCHAVDECLATSGWKNLHLSRKSRRLVMHHPRQGELPISQLSDGVRNMVALVADIAQRAVRLNPQFGEEAARKTPGLVLIDEVDLHLHPEWQQTVLTDLLAAFPML